VDEKDPRTKVLIDGRCFINEGSSPSVYLHGLLKQLAKCDRYLFILLLNNKSYVNEFKNYSNIHPEIIKVKNNIFWDNVILPYYALKNRCRIIFYPKSSSCCYKIPGKKIITTIHGAIYVVEKKDRKLLEKIYWKYAGKIASKVADRVVAVSEHDKQDLISYYGCRPQKIKVIPIGINQCLLQSEKAIDKSAVLQSYGLEEKKYFIQVGLLTKKKNHLFTLRVLKDFLTANKQYKVVFLGSQDRDTGYYSKVLDYIDSNGLNGQIVFLDSIDQNREGERMSVLLRNARLGFFPSTYEGFGIPPLEMIALGVPVLISDRGSLPEVYGKNNTLPLEEENLWIEEIKRLLSDDEYFDSVLKSQQEVIDKYRWENIGEKYLELFAEQENKAG